MFHSILIAATAFLSLTSLTTAQSTSTALRPSSTSTASNTACNNSPDLCSRSYNNITHMGGHNAAFVRDSTTSFSTSGNQYYNATVALSSGLRLLSGQVHRDNGTIKLCHSSCRLLDAGPLTKWLTEIRTWMDSNPNEVVTLILVNSDNIPASEYGPLFTSSGISKYGYTPTSTPQRTWPTLQTMISANTRLVTFIASIDANPEFPYLLSEFSYVFETAFGVTSPNLFNCTIDRPSGQTSAINAISSGFMGMANHFLDDAQSFFQAPNTERLNITNSPTPNTQGGLWTQANQCQAEWGVKPTFLLVNFFNVGPAVATADVLNGIGGSVVGRTVLSTKQLKENTSAGERSVGVGRGVRIAAVVGMGVVALGNFWWM